MTVVDYEHQAIARLLDHVAEATHDPATCEVCGALGLRQHLHDLATCVGIVAESGRCADCGRLVSFAAHKKGGCLMAVPFVGTAVWLFGHREGIPLIGQAIWRYRRRKSTAPSPSASNDRGQGHDQEKAT